MDMHDHRQGNGPGIETRPRIGRWVFWGFIVIGPNDNAIVGS